ncbi:MAG: restriction endonuclease subunit S [Corynebacteriales bacterium]|nr:restriction endonuclease subunit S [Mycobacteriales bacterium]
MSRIDDMIRQMCPDGVDYQELGRVAVLRRGTAITKKDVEEGDIPVIAGGTKPAYFVATSNRSGVTIVVAGSGAYAGHVSYWDIPIFVSDAFSIQCSEDVLIPRFCYHFLKSKQEVIHALKRGGGVPHVYSKDVAKILVPVVPVEIQQEIVRVLDQFTQLEAELEAELEARRDQYAYALQEFLSFDSSVPRAPISSLCLASFSGGTPKVTNPSYYGGDIPWLRTQEVNYRDIFKTVICITRDGLENSSARIVPAGSVVVAISGAGVTRGRAAITRIELATNQHCCALIPHPDRLVSEYLYYWIVRSYGALRKLGRGNRSDLTVGLVKGFEIPVPPVSVQNRVASQLGRFDALVNDLSSGLPAEIAARRKQYEHYRDRLLTFPEMRS